MKKTLFMLSLIMGLLSLGLSHQAFAAPTIDGVLGAGEWANINTPNNTAYPYYLSVNDPNEADNAFDNTDISNAVVLQELTSFSGDGPIPGFTNDGVYILLQVYAPPPTLDWQTGTGIGITSIPNITMQGDLLGDGLSDPFNIFLRHYNTVADFTPGNDVDRAEVCVGTAASCLSLPLGSWTDLTTIGGSFARGNVLEYYIPSGALGTPPSPPGTPFPQSFRGTLTYDNGLGGPNTSDDIVVGQLLVPEPSTMMLTVTGLLGMLGFGKFKFWN